MASPTHRGSSDAVSSSGPASEAGAEEEYEVEADEYEDE
jgi:hypothetical protein